jgi:predicted RNA-binding Zn-ribbon protein involved in translation (DUF1610 family)
MAEALSPGSAPTASKAEFCTSCGVRLIGRGMVQFLCPGDATPLGRCWRCRRQAIAYKCPTCGFSGP